MGDGVIERQFETVFKPKSPHSEVVPYRDGIVTINADPGRLCLDFLEEAQQRKGISQITAQGVAIRLNVFLDPEDFIHHVSVDNALRSAATQRGSQQLLDWIKKKDQIYLLGKH